MHCSNHDNSYLREEALKLVKNRAKKKFAIKLTPGGLIVVQKDAKFRVELSEDVAKRLNATLSSITEDIQQDASKYLFFCPACQELVCKANCWNRSRGICVICFSQVVKVKQEPKKTVQIKAKTFVHTVEQK